MKSNVIRLPDPSTEEAGVELSTEMDSLRNLILGADHGALLQFKHCLNDQEKYKSHLAAVITEAIALRENQDGSIAAALAPTIENALDASVKNNPEPIADALYPIMGPAIRRSIQETMNQALQNFNQSLEETFSLRAVKWRLDAWRSGNSYAQTVLLNSLEYQVEQVFLIHRETSVLLGHSVTESVTAKDADMVSSMLSAIQDFVSDSFSVEGGAGLDTLQLGDLSVSVVSGPEAVMAAVVRGSIPEELRILMHETLETIHREKRQALRNFNGDSEPFVSTAPLLQNCLLGRHQETRVVKQQNPWMIIPILLALLAVVGLAYAIPFQANKQWNDILDNIKAEPGYVLVQAGEKQGDRFIYGLKDPAAREIALVVGGEAYHRMNIQWQFVTMAVPVAAPSSDHMPVQGMENKFPAPGKTPARAENSIMGIIK